MIVQALACLLGCVCGWTASLWIMLPINPMKNQLKYGAAVVGLFAFVAWLATSCAPVQTYAQAQAAEPPPCRDVTLAVLVGECVAEIKAEPNVTKKNKMRADCLERVQAWEICE